MRCFFALTILFLSACGDDGVVGEPGSSAQKRYDAAKAEAAAEAERAKSAVEEPPVPRTLELGDGLVVEVLENGHGDVLHADDEALVHYSISYVPRSEPPKPAPESKKDEATAPTKSAQSKDAKKNGDEARASDLREAAPNDAAKTEIAARVDTTKQDDAKARSDAPKPEAASEAKPGMPASEPAADATEASKPTAESHAVADASAATAPVDSAPAKPPEPIVVATTRESPAPVALRLDDAKALAGLVRGLIGLRVGTRARLTIPANLAYGSAGLAAAGIPPDTQLFADIDVRGVRR